MFKILHGLVNILPDKYLTSASTRTRSQHEQKFRQIQASGDYNKSSFFPKTVRHWNSLPIPVVDTLGQMKVDS